MKKRAILIPMILLFGLLSACSHSAPDPAASTSSAAATEAADGTVPTWINSNILGSVTAETEVSPRDDFHLFVNKDWILSAQIPEGENSVTVFNEINYSVRDQVLSLLEGDEQPGYEGKLAQQLYRAYIDIDARNAAGIAPVMPFIEEIRKIETIDELTAYCQRSDQLANELCGTVVMADYEDSSRNAVFLTGMPFTLDDADEYKHMTSVGERRKQALTPMLEKLLVRVGYSEPEAADVVQRMFDLEGQIASVSMGSEAAKQPDFRQAIYNPVTVAELDALAPVFPITALYGDYIDRGVERFILTDKAWLAKMNEVYTQDNLEGFKAILLCQTLRTACTYLDQSCIDLADEASSIINGIEVHSVLENDAYEVCSSSLDMAIGRMYCDHFVSPETKADVENIIADVISIYKNRLTNNTWLGEETRQKAVEKLDHLRVRVAFPDDWSNYDVSGIVFPEGGTLIDYMLALAQHDYREMLKDSTEPVDPDQWGMPPQTVNAFYDPSDNSINILAGLLTGPFYDAEAPMASNLGGVGVVIAHEITHGFDTTGSQFDKMGNMVSWWTEADRAAFTERTDKVDAYFSSIEVLPGKFCDGQLTIGETVADLGAVSCMLEMAKAKEDFDYNAFFTTYAKLWGRQMPLEKQESLLITDPHAPGHLRTNATVQQFQEFYDTYSVVEGDGMYLAPDKRLSVW